MLLELVPKQQHTSKSETETDKTTEQVASEANTAEPAGVSAKPTAEAATENEIFITKADRFIAMIFDRFE